VKVLAVLTEVLQKSSARFVTNVIFSWREGSTRNRLKPIFCSMPMTSSNIAIGLPTRIVQLNGEPNFSPQGLSSRSHSEYQEGSDLIDMIKEDLVAERITV